MRYKPRPTFSENGGLWRFYRQTAFDGLTVPAGNFDMCGNLVADQEFDSPVHALHSEIGTFFVLEKNLVDFLKLARRFRISSHFVNLKRVRRSGINIWISIPNSGDRLFETMREFVLPEPALDRDFGFVLAS